MATGNSYPAEIQDDTGKTIWGGVIVFTDDTNQPAKGGDVTAADIDSGDATDGQLLTADGAGAASWEDPA